TRHTSFDCDWSSGVCSSDLEVVGESLKLFLNGSIVAYAEDSSITAAGSVGIRSSSGAGASFDNFSAGVQGVTVTLPYTPDSFAGTANNQLSSNWQDHAGNFVDSTSRSEE